MTSERKNIFDKIKEAYKNYNCKVIRNKFGEALKEGDYTYALYLAEINYDKMDLSKRDIDRLKYGFNDCQDRLNDLESKLK
ncbi:MAG: hypothetical protein PHQ66_03070 [Candidatus Nanoarchaeia archaeon]|nr:hypothetical protein [Candidatus Nanoarchaeia archaeon]MDD5357652.1 hypothetical protein [Candidatus Nanoarchaeia archaeon]MDD5588571.1 hypothetical protein [Candidatus Nanoarchaeia archaeon]